MLLSVTSSRGSKEEYTIFLLRLFCIQIFFGSIKYLLYNTLHVYIEFNVKLASEHITVI